ncbi:MAG: FAD/NAD(P)-binding protein [Planctomycetota bacterium]
MATALPAACDTLIIGAGMSGLAAGIRLAQYEHDVLVLDRHSLWGGLNSFYKKAGRPFDVGLHALTNYVPRGTRGRPLSRILRQLRMPYEALALGEQWGSESAFPGVKLRFSNDFGIAGGSEVARTFPGERSMVSTAWRACSPSTRICPPTGRWFSARGSRNTCANRG